MVVAIEIPHCRFQTTGGKDWAGLTLGLTLGALKERIGGGGLKQDCLK